MKISIITVAYNSEKYIENFIQSVLQNTRETSWELVLIDNASADRTVEKINDCLGRLGDFQKSKIKFLKSEKNLGYGGGNNLGAKHSSGDIYVFLNPDTLVEKNWILPIISKFENNPEIGVIGPKILYADRETIQSAGGWIEKVSFAHHYGYGEKDAGQWNTEKEVDYVTGACLAIRKELFEKCLGFDENYFPGYYEETELCAKIRKLGCKVFYVPESVIIHLESQSIGLFSYNYYYWFHKHRWRYILKNISWNRILFFALPYETKWLWGNFVKKIRSGSPREKDAAKPKKKKSPELKALIKAYFATFISLPNIFYYRFFKYYAKK